jgi:hypothetical protein
MTMQFVFDADGLIKLTKGGLLETLLGYAEIVVGPEVWREVVEDGMARGHADAVVIAGNKSRLTLVTPDSVAAASLPESASRLGAGEREAWALLVDRSAQAVVSDDRAFLSHLTLAGVSYLTPAAVVLLLWEAGELAQDTGRAALERLRPFVRQEQVQLVIDEIEKSGGSSK